METRQRREGLGREEMEIRQRGEREEREIRREVGLGRIERGVRSLGWEERETGDGGEWDREESAARKVSEESETWGRGDRNKWMKGGREGTRRCQKGRKDGEVEEERREEVGEKGGGGA